MLHTKFQGNWPSGSGEEIVLACLSYMGMTATLVMLPRSNIQTLFPSLPEGCI